MSKDDAILVIGAAHLDIVGDYGNHVAHTTDKPGDLFYSVGGTAYNLCAMLAQNSAPCAFITSLKEDSLITPIILSRLKSYSIATDGIVISDTIEESGFIALREEGQLVSAVTATTMEKFSFQDSRHGERLKACRFVVVDCNLSSSSLNLIQSAATNAGKKIFVSGVSETKAKRLLEVDRPDSVPFPFFVVAINNFEADALGIAYHQNMEHQEVIAACKLIGAENIIVTLGEKGHCILMQTGETAFFPAPTVSQIVSLTGCGDALLAAVCHYYYQNRDLKWAECQRVISRFVNQVIGRRGATVGARTAPKELRVVPKELLYDEREKHKEKVISVIGSRTISLFGVRVPLSEIFAFVAALAAIGVALVPIFQ